ncbi:MAG: hypothetical protein U9Q74_17825 [Gemmatimonadota bacterium]|nr:hypothetical protein [Gemmatimonadota bacterium]
MTSPDIPVVLFAYRRPDLLARCLASLRANDVSRIYAFSDGPRDASATSDVAAVRALLKSVDWAPLELVAADGNLGVSSSQFRGISAVLDRHEMAVVVEEDLEFGPGTYAFVCEGLRRYREEPRAMGVTAWNHARVTPPGVTQPYFTGRMSGLMWGTWWRAWDGILEKTARELRDDCLARGIDPGRFGADLVESVVHEEERGMWDIRFNLHMLARGGLFLFPARSMVRHTGYDPRATNSPHSAGWEDVMEPAPSLASVEWPAVVEQPGSARLWRAAVAPPRPSWRARLRRLFR